MLARIASNLMVLIVMVALCVVYAVSRSGSTMVEGRR